MRGLNSRDEWLDPQRGANCSREDSGWYSVSGHTSEAGSRRGSSTLSLFIPGHRPLIVYTRGVSQSHHCPLGGERLDGL